MIKKATREEIVSAMDRMTEAFGDNFDAYLEEKIRVVVDMYGKNDFYDTMFEDTISTLQKVDDMSYTELQGVGITMKDREYNNKAFEILNRMRFKTIIKSVKLKKIRGMQVIAITYKKPITILESSCIRLALEFMTEYEIENREVFPTFRY